MKTDTIYYQLFKRFPSLLFTLIEHQPENARAYRFESIEVKETSFRIDGVFLPPEGVSPRIVYFCEVQFQKDESLYFRFFSEISLYLSRNQDLFEDWFGVIIFPSPAIEPENLNLHRSLLNGPQVQRIYLDELGDPSAQPIGVRLMQLTITPPEQAPEQARELIRQANQEDTGFLSKKRYIDMICTIAVYKFSKLSRDEVEAMLGLRLEETRVYQEASAEGEERGVLKGRQEGLEREQSLILRQLTRRIGDVADLQSQIQALSLDQLEALGEALLDFTEPADLVNWLQDNRVDRITG
ncbi:MAG: Rpn family recombination-promoting nuclease/putative transposase [Acaryochloris sp. RU_4_1]|nr:Rpn family recombination-promoting nuclease/putative transposase [Acaryochloris sp. RU_4_1]NJR56665.1 Rpn family recombination-promoting nuclease/putative transposase [Acaryochloris sp. CRU_2_0]